MEGAGREGPVGGARDGPAFGNEGGAPLCAGGARLGGIRGGGAPLRADEEFDGGPDGGSAGAGRRLEGGPDGGSAGAGRRLEGAPDGGSAGAGRRLDVLEGGPDGGSRGAPPLRLELALEGTARMEVVPVGGGRRAKGVGLAPTGGAFRAVRSEASGFDVCAKGVARAFANF